ncbi:hypothetical protein [Thiomicrorhabdus lithotrophica]|uniref:DUF1146 domain-containing protein n=1 Tax=Thiomicrorhabdus lithotrophica TaxID=2949997 RepID=A0ABY8C9U0_9GAMM|nr:hypothetical protein [Thiomicrorhabdus lithotrophica]WEJ61582.1 hypothetical protein NR989_06085 [Thiomicrorhabdus lithotrophica]
MTETELPASIQYLLIALQVIALVVFIYFVWPLVKSEDWKAKFIDNKTARSIIIVFILIFVFVWGLGAFFDAFFPVEELY